MVLEISIVKLKKKEVQIPPKKEEVQISPKKEDVEISLVEEDAEISLVEEDEEISPVELKKEDVQTSLKKEDVEIPPAELKKADKKNKEYNDTKWIYDPYNVYVDERRILAIVTDSYKTTTKWFNEMKKTRANNKHGCIIVTIGVERDPEMRAYHYDQPNREETPYNLLTVCTGSHCLLYRLPYSKYDADEIPKAMKTFFADPRVMVIGTKMRGIMKRFDDDFGIKFANPVDVNILAEVGMQRDDLDLRHYDLNRLAMTVLGKHWDVIKPEEPIEWYLPGGSWWRDELNPEKVKYSTVDPYVSFMISSKILDGMDDTWYPDPLEDFLLKYKKKKSKSKNKCKKKF